MNHLWSPWRMEYIENNTKEEGCIFCIAQAKEDSAENLIAQRGERFDGFVDETCGRNGSGFRAVLDARLKCGEALGFSLFEKIGSVSDMSIDPDLIAGRTAEEFIDRHAEKLSLDVP